MPELPEVETVMRGLRPHIEGRQIVKAVLTRADLRFPLPPGFEARLGGARITRLQRRAKYLLAHLQSRENKRFIWLSHLGMTGRFILKPAGTARRDGWPGVGTGQGDDASEVDGRNEEPTQNAFKHIHLRLWLDDGSQLAYADPRRFGFMDLISGAAESAVFLKNLGPEPLGNEFHAAHLLTACAGRKSPIKNVLLDQRVVAGLGNIYVCEALFMARISPRRRATNVGPTRMARLVPAIRHVLDTAIAAGGSTLRDFAASDGQSGYFQHQFKVYDREGSACANSDCHARVHRLVQSGRSSFFCPSCQR